MKELTKTEKARQTIIQKHGSWEAYIRHRYYDSIDEGIRKERAEYASKGNKGKARGFSDPEVAKRAAEKRWGKV